MIAKLLRTFLNAIQPGDGPEDVNAKDVESWQRIAAAENELEAQIWLDILKSHDVPAYVQGTDALSGVRGTTKIPAPFSLQLWAQTRDALSVRELLGMGQSNESPH